MKLNSNSKFIFRSLLPGLNNLQKRWHEKASNYWGIQHAKRELKNLHDLKNPLFMTCTPGSLHVVDLCLRFVPKSIDVVLVLNGLDQWEVNWVKNKWKVKFINTRKQFTHGKILDLLFDELKQNFGILDYDCFIFDPSIFTQMESLQNKSLLNAIFVHQNSQLNIKIPETFALFFDSKKIEFIRTRYKASCERIDYFKISKKARIQLTTIGIDNLKLPYYGKKVFDTLNLIVSLGISEGYEMNFVRCLTADSACRNGVFHIGGVSRINSIDEIYQFRGSYFWRRVLDAYPDEELRSYYQGRYGKLSAKKFLNQNIKRLKQENDQIILNNLIGDEFFSIINQILRFNI